MKTICKPRLIINRDQSAEHRYSVQLWHSYDGGKTFTYTGFGKSFKDSDTANAYITKNRTPLSVFPIITQERQQAYERAAEQAEAVSYVPSICGYHGRACRQMGKAEGVNRALCNGCKLNEFCAAADMLEYAQS